MKTYFVESVVIAGLMCFGFGCLGRIRVQTLDSSNPVQQPIIEEAAHSFAKTSTEHGKCLEPANQSLDLDCSLVTSLKPNALD